MQAAWGKTRSLSEPAVQVLKWRREQLPQCGEASPTVVDTSEEDNEDEEGSEAAPCFLARPIITQKIKTQQPRGPQGHPPSLSPSGRALGFPTIYFGRAGGFGVPLLAKALNHWPPGCCGCGIWGWTIHFCQGWRWGGWPLLPLTLHCGSGYRTLTRLRATRPLGVDNGSGPICLAQCQ